MLGENMLWQHKRFYVGEHGCCWEPYAPVARMLPNVILLSSLNARRKRMLLYGGHCTDAPGLAVQVDGGGFCTVWHLPGTSTPSHAMTTDVKSTKSRWKKLVYLINLFPLTINDVPPPHPNNKYSGGSEIIYYSGGIFIERIW